MARPSSYTPELAKRIAEAVIEYGTLDRACEAIPSLPTSRTARRWQARHPAFCQSLAQARKEASHTHVEMGVTGLEDLAAQDSPDRAKVRAQSALSSYRMRLAESWNRDAYGPRPEVTLTVNSLVAFSDMTQAARVAAHARLEDTGQHTLPAVTAPDGGEQAEEEQVG